MARYHNPKITINKNLSLVLDAANPKSYTGVTTSVTDISPNNNTATLYNGVGYTSSNVGYFTFDGTNFKCFCNGVLASTINAYNQPYEGDHLIIGGNQISGGNNPNVSDFINAYIDDFRITKGVAKYTGDFIPPDRTKIQNNRASLKFGASGTNNSNPFNGALSNLKIYKDSLTQSEITQNYNAHKSRYGL